MNNKLFFFHDGPRWKNKQGEQFGNSSDIDIYHRYQYLAEEVSFCMRVFPINKTETLTNLNKQGLFINEIQAFNRPSKLPNYFKSKNKIQELIERADIIIVRLPSTIGSIAYWAAKRFNKPVLVEVVACPNDSLRNHSTLGRLYAKLSVHKLKKIMEDASHSIYVTQAFLQKRYPSQGKSIGISDVVLKEKFGTNPKLIKYKHIKPDSLILGTLAAIDVKYKGHDLVLNAIKKLKEKSLNIKYYIAGKGNPQRLIDLAKNLGVTDNIVFLGLLDHSQINSFFEKIDIYVQPSRQEGLPRAVVEAMNFGCACIGSSAGGIPELLHKDVIFKSDSVSSLINKITLFNNPEIFMEQSQINFENAGKYKFIHLEEKRKEFYDDFLKSIK